MGSVYHLVCPKVVNRITRWVYDRNGEIWTLGGSYPAPSEAVTATIAGAPEAPVGRDPGGLAHSAATAGREEALRGRQSRLLGAG